MEALAGETGQGFKWRLCGINFRTWRNGEVLRIGRKCWRRRFAAAARAAKEAAPGLPLLAGGQINGWTDEFAGRSGMVCWMECEDWYFLDFRCIRRSSRERSGREHLYKVPMPMLFLQGTRDALADLKLAAADL